MQRKPNYADFSSQLNDKNIVVLELGRHFTKCGFAGEPAPRAILETAVEDSSGQQVYLHDIRDQDELKKKLSEFIEKIYFNYLAVSPKDKKVVIVESVFCKSIFRYVLIHIFFEQLNIPSIMFVPDHLMALATLGNSTGLIVDIGEHEAISIAVINGVTLLDKTQFSSLGAKTLDSLIYNELAKNNPTLKQYLRPKVIEDIRVKACFVAPYKRGLKITCDKIKKSKEAFREVATESKPKVPEPYTLADQDDDSPQTITYSLGGQRTISIPGNLREGACEILFELRGHEHSLTTMILETIMMAPIDCRRELSENILVIGGVANLPGLEHRLAQELTQIDQPEREKKIIFKFHKPICPKNYVCWLGASMFCTPSSTELRSTTRDKWLKDRRGNIRDWSDMILVDENR